MCCSKIARLFICVFVLAFQNCVSVFASLPSKSFRPHSSVHNLHQIIRTDSPKARNKEAFHGKNRGQVPVSLPSGSCTPGKREPVSVLCFYASWVHPSTQLKASLERAALERGDQLSIQTVDVDDPLNQKLLEQYDICPVPTLVFLDKQRRVISYAIGYEPESDLQKVIANVLDRGPE